GGTETGTEGGLVDQQTVMIEAQSGADGDAAEPYQVLHIGRLFAVGCMAAELERGRRIAVEDAHAVQPEGDNAVGEGLAHLSEVEIGAGLPFVPSAMAGEAGGEPAFTEAAILLRRDRRG